MNRATAARWIEGSIAGLLIPVLGLLRPEDPSFASLGFYPQAVGVVVTAAFLGLGPGLFAISGAMLSSIFVPRLAQMGGMNLAITGIEGLLGSGRFPAALSLCAVLGVGSIHDAFTTKEGKLMIRFRELVRRNRQLKKTSAELVSLNGELESRVSGQRESVSALYTRIRKMDSLDLEHVLQALIEAAGVFSQSERAAIYEFDSRGNNLKLRSWIGAAPETEIPVEGSIEGWVFRNDAAFSLRMLDTYLNLSRLDSKRNILTYPLKAGDLPWGVLNIQEMPFYRYNPVTEKNLEIVVGLAASYLKKAVDFRDRVLNRPRNEITGMPGYGELLRLLGEEIARRAERRASISAVVVEFVGFEEIAFAHSGVKALGLLKDFATTAGAEGNALAFHYKEENQLAFLLPGVDRDGASLFCIGLMEEVNSRHWSLDGIDIRLEPVFGLASAKEGSDSESLLEEAERILSLSMAVFAGRTGIPNAGSNGSSSHASGSREEAARSALAVKIAESAETAESIESMESVGSGILEEPGVPEEIEELESLPDAEEES